MVGFGKLGHLSFNISFVFLFLSSSSGCMYPPISFAEPPCSAARSFSLSNSAATNQTLNCCKPLLNWLTAQSYTQSHNKHTTNTQHMLLLCSSTRGEGGRVQTTLLRVGRLSPMWKVPAPNPHGRCLPLAR